MSSSPLSRLPLLGRFELHRFKGRLPRLALVFVLLVPLLAGPLCAGAVSITVHLPPARRQIEAAWTSEQGFHHWFPSEPHCSSSRCC